VTETRTARDAAEVQAALAIRHAAFVVGQGVALEDELDGRDARAEHLVAVQDSRVVGTCRLLHDAGTSHLGRMAVAPEARRRGIATALLAEAETAARRAGAGTIVLHAQTGALALYVNAGYTPRGERFVDCGIEHLTMEKGLA
jgi:predicted GNAT family N-acyltransferase